MGQRGQCTYGRRTHTHARTQPCQQRFLGPDPPPLRVLFRRVGSSPTGSTALLLYSPVAIRSVRSFLGPWNPAILPGRTWAASRLRPPSTGPTTFPPRQPLLCDIPSGCCFFTGPWTVTRSSLCMLHRVAAFCRPLRPVLLLVSFPRPRSSVVGVLVLDVPGCAVCAPAAPSSGCIGVVLVVAGVV